MRRSSTILLGLLALVAGCRNRSDLVEAELRTRESEMRMLRAELAKAEFMNQALTREVGALQQCPGKISPELASQTYTLKQIVLARQTGGYDRHRLPGDDALMVVLEPRDADGHTIKAPGSVQVTAQEVNAEGVKSVIGSWDIPPEELRRSWKEGFLSKGYHVVLPWKIWPNYDHVRVTARFCLADGRVFEADRDATVRPVPLANRIPLAEPVMQPPTPSKHPIPLPMPRLTESNKPRSDSAAWWIVPAPNASPATEPVRWRPKQPPCLADSVDLGMPAPLKRLPGEPGS